MELFQFMVGYAQTISQFATGIVNPQSPPQIREWFEVVVKTLNRAAERVLGSYGAFDLDDAVVSDVLFQMGQPNPVQPQIAGPEQAQPQQPQAPPPNGGVPPLQ